MTSAKHSLAASGGTASETADEPARSKIAIRAKSKPEPLTWHLDDPAPRPTKMTPVSAKATKPVPGGSRGDRKGSGRRYPVRQAGGQEPLELQPAGEVIEEPMPLNVRPIQIIEEGVHATEPQAAEVYVSPPRSLVSTYQPKKAADAPDFKCPSREELMRGIGELTVDIAPSKGDVPQECPLFVDLYEPRLWCNSLYMWKASSLCHKPLYFEQVALERYGHTWHPLIQPWVSGAHFFGTIPILPYKMGIEDPCECVYALGYYRPGNCAPMLCYQLPLSLRGAVYQAAAVTGVVYLLP